MIMIDAGEACAARSSMYPRAVASSSSPGTTRSTSPSRSASRASTLRALHSRSSAFAGPTSRGSIQLRPCSATSPRCENDVVNTALSEAKRKSHIVAIAVDMPAHGPFTAAITGFLSDGYEAPCHAELRLHLTLSGYSASSFARVSVLVERPPFGDLS